MLRTFEQRLDEACRQTGRHCPGWPLGRSAIGIVVEAFADLLAEVTRIEASKQTRRRRRPGAGKAAAGGHGDVESDHVDEFDRTHRHAEGEHRFVDGLRCQSFVDGAHRFEHVGAEDGVHQEARRTAHRQRQAVDLSDEGIATLDNLRIGALGGNHLDERHLGDGVEEVNADQPRRPGQHATQIFDLEARCVGRQQRLWPHHAFEARQQFALGVEVFEDGLDHHVGMPGAMSVGIRYQPVHDVAQFARIADTLAPDRIGTLQRWSDTLHALILQRDAQPAQRAPGGDVATHHTGANDMHASRPKLGTFAEALETLLEKEHAHQITRCR